jgi:hypothetical protein
LTAALATCSPTIRRSIIKIFDCQHKLDGVGCFLHSMLRFRGLSVWCERLFAQLQCGHCGTCVRTTPRCEGSSSKVDGHRRIAKNLWAVSFQRMRELITLVRGEIVSVSSQTQLCDDRSPSACLPLFNVTIPHSLSNSDFDPVLLSNPRAVSTKHAKQCKNVCRRRTGCPPYVYYSSSLSYQGS